MQAFSPEPDAGDETSFHRVLHYPTFDRLKIRDVDTSAPGPDEVRLKVDACGICGSELESFKNHGMIRGHR